MYAELMISSGSRVLIGFLPALSLLFFCYDFVMAARINVAISNESVPQIVKNNAINNFLNCNQHFCNFKPQQLPSAQWQNCFRVFYLKNIFIFYHWKWPAQGTGTVPILSAHFFVPIIALNSVNFNRRTNDPFCSTAIGWCVARPRFSMTPTS